MNRASRSAIPRRRSASDSSMTQPFEVILPPSKSGCDFLPATAGNEKAAVVSSIMADVAGGCGGKVWRRKGRRTALVASRTNDLHATEGAFKLRRILQYIPLAVLFCSGLLLATITHARAETEVNCKVSHGKDLNLDPIGFGPLRVARVYRCKTALPPGLFSPDGKSIAYRGGLAERVVVGRLEPTKLNLTGFPLNQPPGEPPRIQRKLDFIFGWSADSRSILTGSYDIEFPSHFRTSPLTLERIFVDSGEVQPLPKFEHQAGPLDELLLANSDGLALAWFGTRGNYYRPEHKDPAPTLAIVDVFKGGIRESFRTGLPASVWATTLKDGRIKALLNDGTKWLIWTQGQKAELIPNLDKRMFEPYYSPSKTHIALAPDGSSALVTNSLQPAGTECGRTGGCTKGTPVEGVLASLHDLGSGAAIWNIRATVEDAQDYPVPAISPDGRYALIGLVPPNYTQGIGLVSMKDGRIVQTIPWRLGLNDTIGFSQAGHMVWFQSGAVTALYDFDP